MAVKPQTQKEMIDQLWYAVIGTNGDGLVGRMAKVEQKLDTRPAMAKKPRRVEIMLSIMGGLVAAQTLGLVDGLRLVIYQWVNGGPG